MKLSEAVEDVETVAGTTRANIRAFIHNILNAQTTDDIADAECVYLSLSLAMYEACGVNVLGQIPHVSVFERNLNRLNSEIGIGLAVLVPNKQNHG